MANKQRPKMSPADRAKQFMPFDAVKGLREALARKEAELLFVERNDISEDGIAYMNEMLSSLSKDDRVRVSYYADHIYHTVSETVVKVDAAREILVLSGLEIAFSDITEISRSEEV